MLWEPSDMEHALEKQLKKLEGLGNKQSKNVLQIITNIINKVNEAQDEGYLYNSYYDQIFDAGEIVLFVRNFIESLTTIKKVTYLNELEEMIKDSSYITFGGIMHNVHQLFHEEDLQELKGIIISNVTNGDYRNIEAYYLAIEPIVTTDEKSYILSRPHHLDPTLSIHLAKLYESQGEIDQAIEALENSRKKQLYWSHKEVILSELLRLRQINNTLKSSFADEVLQELSNKATLRQVIGYFPDRKNHLEKILQGKNALESLEYLEEEGRLGEALKLVMVESLIWEDRRYAFMRKHKKSFPEYARTYFIARIDNNLEYTGNKYYSTIADTLKSLHSIDPPKATEIKDMIKQNYKRRINLMKLLE